MKPDIVLHKMHRHLIAAAALSFSLLSGCGESEPDEIAAYVMCQEFVKDRLKAPASAGFPLMHEVSATETGDQEWRIRSHVDAENSFGAQIRNQFECQIRYVGNDEWELVSLDLDE